MRQNRYRADCQPCHGWALALYWLCALAVSMGLWGLFLSLVWPGL